MRTTEELMYDIAEEARDEICQYLDKPIYLPESAVDPVLEIVLRAVKRANINYSVREGF